jgi:Mg-chelatase subunit ChlD
MKKLFLLFLALLSLSGWLWGQPRYLEFADKPRLIECKDQPCFRILLNSVDAEGRPAPLALASLKPEDKVTVTEGVRRHPVFYIQSLEADLASRGNYSMLLVDISGSMNIRMPSSGITRFEAAKRALNRHLMEFREGVDHLAVVPFESHQVAQRIRGAVFADTVEGARRAISSLPLPQARNNTALFSAIHEALPILQTYKEAGYQTSLVVLTDGKNDVRPPPQDDPGLLGVSGFPLVKKRADETGIQIVTIGFGATGEAFDEPALRALAWPSESNYYYAGDEERLEQVFSAAREKLTNRLQVTFGPVRRDKNQLTGQSMAFRVFLETADLRKLESRSEPSWVSPAIGSPSYEGTLDRGELSALVSRPLGPDMANPLLARLARRSVITLIFGTILAFLWFGFPRLVWPERYVRFPVPAHSMPAAASKFPVVRPPSSPEKPTPPRSDLRDPKVTIAHGRSPAPAERPSGGAAGAPASEPRRGDETVYLPSSGGRKREGDG